MMILWNFHQKIFLNFDDLFDLLWFSAPFIQLCTRFVFVSKHNLINYFKPNFFTFTHTFWEQLHILVMNFFQHLILSSYSCISSSTVLRHSSEVYHSCLKVLPLIKECILLVFFFLLSKLSFSSSDNTQHFSLTHISFSNSFL